jgi:hypothetical protein
LDTALPTVSGILTRIGLGKLGRLGLEPVQPMSEFARASLSISTSRSSGGSKEAPANAGANNRASTATQNATGFEVIELPRSARIVSCPESICCWVRVWAMSCSATGPVSRC